MACKKCKGCATVNCSNCSSPCAPISSDLIGTLSYVKGVNAVTGCEGYHGVKEFYCGTVSSIVAPQTVRDATSTDTFLNASCELVKLPASVTFEETELTVVDSSSINLIAGASGNGHTGLSAEVKISASAGNQVVINGDGIYVPPGSAETQITVTDTPSINLTSSGTSGHTIQADVKLSATAGNALVENADGLYAATAAPETALTATDTNSINLTTSGTSNHTIQADIILSSTADNNASIIADGLFVPKGAHILTTGFQDVVAEFTQPFKDGETLHIWSEGSVDLTLGAGPILQMEVFPSAAAGNILTINALDNRLYVAEAGFTVSDTNSVNLTKTGIDISADVRISASPGNAIVENADGLFAIGLSETDLTVSDSQTVQLVATGTANHNLVANVKLSTAADNALVFAADGLYVSPGAETVITAVDTPTVNLTTSGTANHTVQADVLISTTVGNILTAVADGLFVPPVAETALVTTNSSTINFVTSGASGHELTGNVAISPNTDNLITDPGNGLFAFSGQVGIQTGFVQPDNMSAIAALNTLTFPLGTIARVDVAGVPSWFKYDGITWLFIF